MSKLQRIWYSGDGLYIRSLGRTPRLIPVPSIPTVVSRGQLARISLTATIVSVDDPTALPTGAAYTLFNSLIQPGDIRSDGSMPVTTIMNRAPAGTILTFLPGVYADRDFNAPVTACIYIPKFIKGIIGSGRGTLGGSDGTIFSMVPLSSTKNYPLVIPGSNPPQYYVPQAGSSDPIQLHVLKQIDQNEAGVWKNFQVRGTDQGHNFSGSQWYGTVGANTFENLLFVGHTGDAGEPPGETMGLGVNGPGEHIVKNVECDGRRVPGGQCWGSAGMTFQNAVRATFDNVVSHYCRAAQIVFYQCFDCTIKNSDLDAASAGTWAIGNGSMNSERTSGCKMINCRVTARKGKVHITHSNDYFSMVRYGVTYSAAGGLFVVIDPNPDNGNPLGNGYMYIQSWAPYSVGKYTVIGDSMSYPDAVAPARDGPDCSPFVFNGTTGVGIKYVWVYGVHHLLNSVTDPPSSKRDLAAYNSYLAAKAAA